MSTTTLIEVILLMSGADAARAQDPTGQTPSYSPPVAGQPAPLLGYASPVQQQAPVWIPPETGHSAPYVPGFGPPLAPQR